MNVLALNSGSSSLKFGLYSAETSGTTLLMASTADPAHALADIQRQLADEDLPPPDAIGHRLVHGGPALHRPCMINDKVLRQLESSSSFAPLHMPRALALIRDAEKAFPELPQVVCFDTGFHARLPDIARVLPVPKALQAHGVRRYGFHGLSCESILHQLGDEVPARVIIAHLGNGASITAVDQGQSIDTSMGLTPGGGLIMGSRSGDLDPGLLLWLMRNLGYDADAIETLVEHQSGLLGISGISSDLRDLHAAAAESNADAALALHMFCRSVLKEIAAMIVVLDGVDLIVFTGGIGEHDAAVRAEVCLGLRVFGIRLDASVNHAGSITISAPSSRCSVKVMPSREEDQIARQVLRCVQDATMLASA